MPFHLPRPARLCPPLAAAALAVLAPVASAQTDSAASWIKPGEESVILNLGAILNNFNTSVQLNGDTTKGTNIHLEDVVPKSQTSVYASGTWRFLPNHRIDAQYYNAKRSGTKSAEADIVINGSTIPVGASISVDNRTQFFTADYRYSFVKDDTIEFAGMLGFYGGQFKYDFSGSAKDGSASAGGSLNRSTTVPLPLIGASLDWYIDPRWHAAFDIAGLKAKVGDVDGSVLLLSAAADYMLLRNLGIGARYMYSDVSATVTKSSFNGDLGFRANSVSLYAKLMF